MAFLSEHVFQPFTRMDGAALVVIVSAVLFLLRQTHGRSRRLPPGPRGYPFVGNLLDIPAKKEALAFAELGKRFGPITSLSVPLMGRTIVIVNSFEHAIAMLEKKSSIYSSRVELQMAGKLIGWDKSFGFTPYGERLRLNRKLMHQELGTPTLVKNFDSQQASEARKLLQHLLHSPGKWLEHCDKFTGSLFLRITYGVDSHEENDRFLALANKAVHELNLVAGPGQTYLVDIFPILRLLPNWFPGTGFKQVAKEFAESLRVTVDEPYNFIKAKVAAGDARESFASRVLNTSAPESSPIQEEDLKWLFFAFYGGEDTTRAGVYAFFLLMALFPGAQKRAQAELDRVVGTKRLPGFKDRADLPYVNALCKEVLRFHTIGPTAVPHCSTADDVHDGYFIPKGSLVIPNIWQMAHDPSVYRDPMDFNPSRFLDSEGHSAERDPRLFVFGFGRRICPGKNFADATLFITCAMVLATFDISLASNTNHSQAPPELDFSAGIVSFPVPFEISIIPRSKDAEKIVLE